MKPFQKEINLLLCCSKQDLTNQDLDQIELSLQGNLNWEYIIQFSLRHKIIPSLYKNLSTKYSNIVPVNVFRRLQMYFIQNSARNFFLTQKLIEILDLFENNSIKVIPFKGPVIAELIYNDISRRQFDDIDILIRKQDVFKAAELLYSFGYYSDIKLTKKQESAFLKTENSINIINHNPHFIIELHWELLGIYSSLPMTFESMEEGLKMVTIAGMKVKHFSQEDLLIYLCIHGAKHSWYRLEWIYCISQLISKNKEMDWGKIQRNANRMSCERMIGLGICLANELFNTPVADRAIQFFLKDPMIRKITIEIIGKLFKAEDSFFEKTISNRYSIFHLKVRKRVSDKLRYIVKLVFYPSEKEWIEYPLPSSLLFLYYLIRPFRLALDLKKILFKSC